MEYAKIGCFIAKVESTFGTDAAPTTLANNIPIARGLVPVEPDGTPVVREILDGGWAKVAGLTTMKTMTFKVRIELRGNRTDGTTADISSGSISNVLDYDPLLRACDLAATYVAAGGTRDGMVIYQPSIPTDAGVSLTIWAYSPQKLYKAVGCKGTIDNIVFGAGQICYVDMTFMGQFSSISDNTPLPTDMVWPSTVPPIWAVAQVMNGTSVTFGYPPGTAALAATAGNYKGDRIKLGGTPPAEFTAGTWYYVSGNIASTGAAIHLAATLNGTSIQQGSAGTSVTATSAGGFWLDGWTDALVNNANIKLGQVLTPREDANSSSGLKGHVITGRESTGDFTIESVPEATHPLWADWSAGTVKTLRMNLGAVYPAGSGNRIAIEAKIRLGAMKYQDQSGKRMMNVPFNLAVSSPGDASGSDFKLIVQ